MRTLLAVAAGTGLLVAGLAAFATQGQGPSVSMLTRQWPAKSREAALAMEKKYGAPVERTATMLIWNRTGPWKRTMVYSHEVPHAFPKPHTDVMEQFIDYRVPLEKIDDIITYDGSVVIQRTNGELSARCDMEEMNFLAINLAHEVATGRRNVDEARSEYGRVVTAFMGGQKEAFTQGLQFTLTAGSTRDPDQSTITTSSR